MVVGIKKNTNQQIIHYRLEGTTEGRMQKFRGKTIGYKRYKIEEGLIEGYMW